MFNPDYALLSWELSGFLSRLWSSYFASTVKSFFFDSPRVYGPPPSPTLPAPQKKDLTYLQPQVFVLKRHKRERKQGPAIINFLERR